jgi:hypothetical protein
MLQAERWQLFSNRLTKLQAMKKILFFSAMAMILVSGSAFANISEVCIPSPPGFWIKFHFAFHKPSTNCKSEFGICGDVTAGFDGSSGGSEKALCPVSGQLTSKKQLIIMITEADLNKYERGSVLPHFKGKNNITILESYTLSQATSKALGSNDPVTIKSGIYPVVFDNGTYTITFQL